MINQYNPIMGVRLRTNHGRKRRGHLLALVVLVVCLGSLSASADASDDFCAPDTVRDYLSPIDRISVASTFNPTGELGVGPPSLRLYVQGSQLVPLGKGLFSARGYVKGQKNDASTLGWRVTSYLEKIGKDGSAKVIRRKRQLVERVPDFSRRFGFASTGVPSGMYRLAVQIRNRSGKLLEKHERAFRALPAKSDLRLAKSFTNLAPGESGFIRIDNYGTINAEFGANYRLWSSTGEEVPVNPIFSNVGYILPAGRAASCWRFTAPDNLAPGEYIIGSFAGDSIQHKQLLTTSFVVK